DLQEPLRGRAAAAREPVAAVLLARELDAELLEPRDRARRLGGENFDELRVGRLVRALEDVGRVLLRRVVGAERGLNAPLRLRGVARLDRALRREADARAGALSGDGGSEARGSATDHEYVEAIVFRHVGEHSASCAELLIQRIAVPYLNTPSGEAPRSPP